MPTAASCISRRWIPLFRLVPLILFLIFARPAGAALTVVVLGSSTASGAGASPYTQAWAYRFQSWLAARDAVNRVIIRAVPGYTTYHLMPSGYAPPPGRPAPDASVNITYALAQHPDALIINLPSNDTALGYPLAEQKSNFLTLAKLAQDANIPLWVTTTQPRYPAYLSPNLVRMRDWIRETFGPRAIDFWSGLATAADTLKPEYDAGDGIHVNNGGHAIFYQRVVEADIPGAIAARTGSLPGDPFGDLDADGAVTASDVDLLRTYLSDPTSLSPAQKERIRRYGDVSDAVNRTTAGNGVLDRQDTSRLLLLHGGLIDAGTAGASRRDYGDVNGDGCANIVDAVALARFESGRAWDPETMVRAWTNGVGDISPTVPYVSIGDGKIDERDLNVLTARVAGKDSYAPAYVDYWPLHVPFKAHPEVTADWQTLLDVSGRTGDMAHGVEMLAQGVEEWRGYTVLRVAGTDGSVAGMVKGQGGALSMLYFQYPYAFGSRQIEFQTPVRLLDGGAPRGDTSHWSGEAAAACDDGTQWRMPYTGTVLARADTYTAAAGAYPDGTPRSAWSKSVSVRLDVAALPLTPGSLQMQQAFFFDLAPFVGPVRRGQAPLRGASAPTTDRPYLDLQRVTVRGITYSQFGP